MIKYNLIIVEGKTKKTIKKKNNKEVVNLL